MPNTSYGTPYAASSDTLTGWPTVSQNVANAIDAIGYQNGRGNNSQTGTAYTMVIGDAGKTITRSNAAASTHTIPTNASVAFPVGTRVTVTNLGAGAVTINGSGVTILGDYKVLSQYETATVVKTATDTWVVEESVGLAAKLDSATASSTYAPKASPTFTGVPSLPAGTLLDGVAMPLRWAVGYVNTTSGGGVVSITFPAGRFSVTPWVFCQVLSDNAAFATQLSATTTGFTLRTFSDNGSLYSRECIWMAVQV